jgi:hypothetical protein
MPIQPEEESDNLCEMEHRSKPRRRAIHAADRCTLDRESGSLISPFRNETPSKCLVNVQAQLSDIFFKGGRVSNWRQTDAPRERYPINSLQPVWRDLSEF